MRASASTTSPSATAAQQVLDGVSLEVESGETVVVCGPSGGGKTVLLRLIAGTELARPRRHPHRRHVGARPAAPRSATSAWRSRTSRSTRTSAPSRTSRARCERARPGRGRDQGSEVDEDRRAAAHRPCARPHAARAVQRPEAAHLAGPRAGARPRRAPARRSVAQRRRQAALRDAPRAAAAARELRLGRDLRHPGLSRGDGAGPAHRRPAPRPVRAGRRARPRSMASRPTSRSPACSAIRRSTSIRCRPQDGRPCELFGERGPLLGGHGRHLPGREVHDRASGPRTSRSRLEPVPGAVPAELDAVTPLNVRAVLYLRSRDGEELLATVAEDDALRFGRGHRAGLGAAARPSGSWPSIRRRRARLRAA